MKDEQSSYAIGGTVLVIGILALIYVSIGNTPPQCDYPDDCVYVSDQQ